LIFSVSWTMESTSSAVLTRSSALICSFVV
jgi:hypothetical protein